MSSRAVNVIHSKALAAGSEHVIASDHRQNWSRRVKEVRLNAYSISGNGSTLPPVVFLVLSLSSIDRYTSVSPRTVLEDVRIPLYSVNNGYVSDDRVVYRGSDISNVRARLEVLNATTLNFDAFTDYTLLVYELECQLENEAN